MTVGVFDINAGRRGGETVKAIEAADGRQRRRAPATSPTTRAVTERGRRASRLPAGAGTDDPRQQRRLGHADAVPEDRRGVLEEGRRRSTCVRPAAHDACASAQGMAAAQERAHRQHRVGRRAASARSGEVVYSGCKGATHRIRQGRSRARSRATTSRSTPSALARPTRRRWTRSSAPARPARRSATRWCAACRSAASA